MEPSLSPFDLETWLPQQQERVELALASRLEALVGLAPPKLLEAMRYSLLGGGKRLRPILCIAFADGVTATSSGARVVLDAAAAVEFVHTYSLVHDDLPAMDDDALRRGRPTSHIVFGEAMAILAGDALLTEAFALLATGSADEMALRGILAAELGVAAGARGMVGGQVMDIAEERPAQKDYLLEMHARKTGALIRAACRMGALAGGASPAQLAAAASYGEAIGLAFQIADDVLDVTQSAEVMGKPTQADASKGRFTFPAVFGLAASRAMAQEKVSQAISAIGDLEPQGGPLSALARFTVERTR